MWKMRAYVLPLVILGSGCRTVKGDINDFRVQTGICNSRFDQNGNHVEFPTFKVTGLTLSQCVAACESAAFCRGFERYSDQGGAAGANVDVNDCLLIGYDIDFTSADCDPQANNLILYERQTCEWVALLENNRCTENIESFPMDYSFKDAPESWGGCQVSNGGSVQESIEVDDVECQYKCLEVPSRECKGFQYFTSQVNQVPANTCRVFLGDMQDGGNSPEPRCRQVDPENTIALDFRCAFYAQRVKSCGMRYSFNPQEPDNCSCTGNGVFDPTPSIGSQPCVAQPAQGYTVYERVCQDFSPTPAPTRSPVDPSSPTAPPTPPATAPPSPATTPPSTATTPPSTPSTQGTPPPTGTSQTAPPTAGVSNDPNGTDPPGETGSESYWWVGAVAGGVVVLGGMVAFGLYKSVGKNRRSREDSELMNAQLANKTESMFSGPKDDSRGGKTLLVGALPGSAPRLQPKEPSGPPPPETNARSTFGMGGAPRGPLAEVGPVVDGGKETDNLEDISWLDAKKLAKQLGIQNTYGSRDELLVRIGTALSNPIQRKGTIGEFLTQMAEDEASGNEWRPSFVAEDPAEVTGPDV